MSFPDTDFNFAALFEQREQFETVEDSFGDNKSYDQRREMLVKRNNGEVELRFRPPPWRSDDGGTPLIIAHG